MLSITGFGAFVLQGQQYVLRSLTNDVFEEARQVRDVRGRLSNVHANIYHLIGTATNDSDVERLQKQIKGVDEILSKLTASTKPLRAIAFDQKILDSYGIEPERESRTAEQVVLTIREALRTYVEAAQRVTSLLAVDSATALLYMHDAEESYKAAVGHLSALESRTSLVSKNATVASQGDLNDATMTFAIVAILAIALVLGVSLFVVRAISLPVTGLTRSMDVLSKGGIDQDVPYISHQDEVGAMARALEIFRINAETHRRLEASQQEEHRAKEVRAVTVDRLLREFDGRAAAALSELSAAGQRMNDAAVQMATVAEQTNAQSQAVSAASDVTSGNVQTVAAAAEELSLSIQEIGHSVSQSAQITSMAVSQAQHTAQNVQELSEATRNIGEIVDLIQSIAGQTNLLALNATIEASRAGDIGKGFAVVASEVKSLANQTAKATESISAQIAGIQAASATTVDAIAEITATIRDMNQITTTIAAAVEQQSAATVEISRSVQEAAVSTQQVSANIGGVSGAAEAAGRAAAAVLSATEWMAKRSTVLQADVHTFLAAIKSA
ncbi:methyl-accepting chemotaxis protein [Azospirillum griseum]|uniref:methyl-accepting chemotaxis protein n=1 Tax=Azospirillum griseum TaxID=2496639 RepID=UPI0013154477|nr:HAMP domain-containing methyl-accepting chemotaxis protein [Azospirillum griseum]